MRSLRAPVLFVALFGFWLVLSARLDPLFLVLGLLSAAGVTVVGLRLLDTAFGPSSEVPRVRLWPMITFLAWLLTRIPPAGIQIAQVVLDPRRPPRPGVFRFRSNLESPAARTMLATAITLVPGTMTLNVAGDEFTIHAFTPDAAADLASAEMQRRIAHAFGQIPDAPPELIWEPVHDELPEDPR